MANIKLIIKIPEEMYKWVYDVNKFSNDYGTGDFIDLIKNGTPLPKGHGRMGDLDELEQRISNFVEHDAKITDEYTVIRQRFIVDGIRQTPTIIAADKAESENNNG